MADTSVKLSGTYDSIEAYNILEEMRDMSADYEEIRTEAAAAASAATAAVTTAQTAANSASTYAGNAQTYAGNANTSAGEAAGYAADASTSATNAASSETNASNSATAAAASASNAAASEAVVAGALPLSGGTMTGNIFNSSASLFTIGKASSVLNQGVRFWGGSGFENGASLYLYGKSHTNAGQFMLYAHDGTASRVLIGTPAGSLTWLGKEVERVNSIGSNYIRYENGLQICWGGTSTITTATTVTVNLPVAFVNDGYSIAIGRWWVASAGEEYYVHDSITTSFKLTTIGSVGGGAHSYKYIAIGKWK